jgi:excisionase family DNA binding protein
MQNKAGKPDEWLTLRELAEWLKVPTRTVEKWNCEGTGPRRHRLGRAVRYRRTDVEAWLDQRAA